MCTILSSYVDELASDYLFTFSLDKESDLHITQINMKSTPGKLEFDVDFNISCTTPAKARTSNNLSSAGGADIRLCS